MIGLVYRAADRIRRRRHPEDHGRIGEDLAHRHLRRNGCTVVARNYRVPSGGGEIDIVAWDKDKLAFVEVKTRATADFGQPEVAVDSEKHELAPGSYFVRMQPDGSAIARIEARVLIDRAVHLESVGPDAATEPIGCVTGEIAP